MKNEITYKLSDTSKGHFLTVNLPEGTFNLTLSYHTGFNNTREWKVNGNYPKDKYSITYTNGNVFILKIGGEYAEGQKVTHKAFGKGVITFAGKNTLTINFKKVGEKSLMKSIAGNFLK